MTAKFNHNWVAPNGVPVVEGAVKFPDDNVQVALVGVYWPVGKEVEYDGQWWQIQTHAKQKWAKAQGGVMYFIDGDEFNGQPRTTAGQKQSNWGIGRGPNLDAKSTGINGGAWFWHSNKYANKEEQSAYAWGLVQEAAAHVAKASGPGVTVSSATQPGRIVANQVLPPPVAAPSKMKLYLGLAAAAVAGYILLD
jgi:hypothetical protein